MRNFKSKFWSQSINKIFTVGKHAAVIDIYLLCIDIYLVVDKGDKLCSKNYHRFDVHFDFPFSIFHS